MILRKPLTVASGPLLLLAAAGPAQPYTTDWQTIDCGGGMVSTGGAYTLAGTIGQPDAGAMSGGNYVLIGGFWSVLPAGPAAPGDCDADGDVDLTDYAGVPACFSGPEVPAGTGCECLDGDADADVDLLDFAEFQAAFTGP